MCYIYLNLDIERKPTIETVERKSEKKLKF